MSGYSVNDGFDTRWIRRGHHRIFAKTRAGNGAPLVLMHGFPDNHHLYDRLIPHIRPDRPIVTFDFLGWGESDKPMGYPYTATNQIGDLSAVIDELGLGEVILVAHDASGPPAIDWALAHESRVKALILLNTYYAWHRGLRRPEAIFLYSTPVVRQVTRAVLRKFDRLDRSLFFWQVGRFIEDPTLRASIVAEFYSQFRSSRPAFWRLNDDLLPTVIQRRSKIKLLAAFSRPVGIIFGAKDPYLNTRVAATFHRQFPTSTLSLIPGARHYVQVDAPAEVAEQIEAVLASEQ